VNVREGEGQGQGTESGRQSQEMDQGYSDTNKASNRYSDSGCEEETAGCGCCEWQEQYKQGPESIQPKSKNHPSKTEPQLSLKPRGASSPLPRPPLAPPLPRGGAPPVHPEVHRGVHRGDREARAPRLHWGPLQCLRAWPTTPTPPPRSQHPQYHQQYHQHKRQQ